jgi:N utilization substance protein B
MIYPTKKREKARKFAMQALYTWQVSGNDLHDIEKYYLADRNPDKFDLEYFKKLLYNVPGNLSKLDEQIIKYSEREIEQIGDIEHSILRVAIYELQQSLDVPYKVIIFEALELANVFGNEDGRRYINAVLDRAAKEFRATEIDGAQRIIS